MFTPHDLGSIGHFKFHVGRVGGRFRRAGDVRANGWTDITWPVANCIAINSTSKWLAVELSDGPAPSPLENFFDINMLPTCSMK